jgi:hypothetical protein
MDELTEKFGRLNRSISAQRHQVVILSSDFELDPA